MAGFIDKLKGLRAWGAEAARQALEPPLYDLAMRIYSAGVSAASIANPKARLLRSGQKGVLRRLRREIDPGSKWLWMHVASLGEFEQGRPVLERIHSRYPGLKILLTFFSPSGYEVRKNYQGADIICYLPFDTARNARRFLDIVRPEKAIFVKYEFWRNYLTGLAGRGVPTYLISAVFRPDQKFFKKSGSWYKAWLRCFTHIFVQDSGSARLLNDAGFGNVTVAGDTRFDRVTDIRAASKEIPELEAFRKDASLTFMAGSSWPRDEDVYIPWVLEHPDVKCVIAPHEFDSGRLADLKARFQGKAILLSELRQGDVRHGEPEQTDRGENPGDNDIHTATEGKQALIIDCFGLLSSAYAYADMAYVGGAFGAGLHNINEAAVYGIPVFFGPRYDKFIEARDLVTLGGGISIDGPQAFARKADRLLFDPAERRKRGGWAGDYIREKTGASDKVFSAIFPPRQ